MRSAILAALLASAASALAVTSTMLDLSPHFWERFATPTRTNRNFTGVMGRRTFDGVPFQVDGRACLYGKTQGNYGSNKPENYPDIVGVRVGRAFDELHLLHAAQWSDVEGTTIAIIRLHYADGTTNDFPIGYGVHVRDWQRLISEEAELITDPDTKVVWRGPGIPHFKSTQRMFKTRLCNPRPDQVVETIDFLSTGQIASYDISAATVTDRDPARPVSPAIPLTDPVRNFDGRIIVKVEDLAGHPIEDVWVYPNISVPDTGWCTVAAPFYTDAAGLGTSRYPRARSTCVVFIAEKEGWRTVSETVHFSAGGGLPNGVVVTIRMAPVPRAAAAGRPSRGAPAPAVTAGGAVPAAAGGKKAAEGFVPSQILLIDFPVGSRVRIETSAQLAGAAWTPLETITNLPFAPYPFTCCADASAEPQQFFRAVLEP